jgi:light-regulated signal transduction histidine kinase (bacteriophytochrome)
MKTSVEYYEMLSDRSKVIGCLLLSLLLGYADYVTGDYSLSLFYLLPIAIASWFIGKRAALFIATVCAVELYSVGLIVAPGKISVMSLISWNAIMEVCYLFLAAYLIFKVRVKKDLAKQRAIALESANRELESFSYSVSHDLRSPLVWIGGYCRSILKHNGDKLDELHREQLKEACEGILRMEHLIAALLDLSRQAQCELICTATDLSEMAKSVASELVLAEPGRRVIFNIAAQITGTGDQRLLRVVVENLLRNAWKYTSEREDAVIEFGVTKCEGNQAYFVRDNGAGFDMAFAEKLFVPFQRLHGTEIFKGHGIGLATVKRIISRHNGKIWAESSEGNGATFYFTLG